MEGANATLNLERGSILQGGIHFTDADSATLNFGAGLNAAVQTFAPDPAPLAPLPAGTVPAVPATITSTGVYTVSGGTVYNADLSDYAAQDQAGATSARLITDAVDLRRSTRQIAPSDSCDSRWGGVTGGAISKSGDDESVGFDGAVISGTYGQDCLEGMGFFAGASVGSYETDNENATDTIGVHGGIYGQWGRAEYTLAAGLGYSSTDRTQANSAIAGGLEDASASYMSVFVAPSMTWNGLLGSGNSLRVMYAGTWYGGHTYSFKHNDLEVDGRLTHSLEARMAWSSAMSFGTLRYGADLGWQSNSDVDVTLAGKAGTATLPGDAAYGRAFIGMDLKNGGFELGYDSKNEMSVTGSYIWQF